MEEPNFWDNPEEAQEQMKQLSSMKEDRDTYQKLVSAKEDMETLIEMGQEDDDSVVPEIAEMMEEFKASFDAIRIKTLLSGEFDKDNAIIKLNAGAGGTEACDWCGMLYRMYTRWAEKKGFSVEVLDYLDGEEAGIKSVTFQVNGENAYGYLKSEKGVHRLVRISPFNAQGKRQTSFVSLDVMPDIEEDLDVDKNELADVPKHVRVYEISGPLFFGAAEVLTEIEFKDFTKCLVLRMRSVPALDITAMNALENLLDICRKQNIRLILSHVNAQPMHVMEKAGFIDKVGKENFRPNIEAALEWATQCTTGNEE